MSKMNFNKVKAEEEAGTKELVPATDFNSFLAALEPIPEETLAEVVKDADGMVTWVKYNASGFTVNDTVIPRLQGIIQYVHPYFAKWEADQVEKLDTLDDLGEGEAEGFERRCDIHIMTVAGLLVGISMAKSSYYGAFAPFVKMLDEKGLNPSDVVVEVYVAQKKNQFGVYNVLRFTPVKFLKEAKDDFGEIPI